MQLLMFSLCGASFYIYACCSVCVEDKGYICNFAETLVFVIYLVHVYIYVQNPSLVASQNLPSACTCIYCTAR